jgi:hypothetical protein
MLVALQVLYAAGLLGGLWLVLKMWRGGWDAGRFIQAGFALAATASVVGFVLAYEANPDWNPFTLLALYLPYFAIAGWSFHASRLVRAGANPSDARRKGVVWVLPTMLLAPVVMALLWAVIPAR